MSDVHLSDLDLNLLVVLRELLRTHSTTSAAKRLGRTQSAVSHALARLRDLFGDPLFLRTGGALRPTARAESLAEPLEQLLSGVDQLLRHEPSRFDPSQLERTFVLAATDYAEILLLPELVPALRAEAPGVDLVTRFPGDEIDRAVATREVDVALGTNFRPLAGVLSQPVGHQDMVLVARRGHPVARAGRARRALTVEAYSSLDHVLVAPRGFQGGAIDAALEKVGLSRRVVLRVPHFAAAAFVVASTDLVVALPESFARTMAKTLPLSVLPLPIPLAGFTFSVAFSAAARDDPAHAWLRKHVVRAGKRAFAKTARRA
ncbi:MAG TPA: LysR family transcriptional regulator [Polyangiaceae bacterium]|nr:LysR family transcriptional regulator [Polyangiaceae bacterium]